MPSLVAGIELGSLGSRLQSMTRREYPESTAGASSAAARRRVTAAAPMSQPIWWASASDARPSPWSARGTALLA